MAHYLVIAASSSIGQCVVQDLLSKGHTVFTTARNKEKIVPDVILDASNFQEVNDVFNKAGSIDGVVNCSGSLLLKPAHLTKEREYYEVINASLTTAFATVQAAGRNMTRGGSVVLISSSASLCGIANHEAIAAAKAGINGLVLSAAATYASINLRFNAVAPGLVKTALTSNITNNEISLKFSKAMHPLGRIGSPEEIAKVIVFLLDNKNSWITGQIIAVDGGISTIKQKVPI